MSHINTKCVQGGWEPETGQSRVLPIFQSTTFKYNDPETLGDMFDLKKSGHFYTRLSNPTLEAVERKIAELEGGIGAMLTSSGQAAITAAVLTLCQKGDHIVSSNSIYGGTYNLFSVTLRQLGIETTFISPDSSEQEIEAAIKPNTKLIFGETIANPALTILDIEKFAKISHKNGIPLVVDNTFATPINCRPIEFGADIVIHSASKYLDGHAVSLGGAVVDSGNFDWTQNDKFPQLCTPDHSYHGVVFTQNFGKAAFIAKARLQIMRDIGMQMSPMNAFLLNLGLETLHLRVKCHVDNATAVAKYLKDNKKIIWVNYPGLEDSEYAPLVNKYLPNGTCGVISFGIKGGRAAAATFMENLKLAAVVIHVADARTSVLHPASTTHRQLTDEQMLQAGVSPDLIRMSVGIEHVDDIIADIEQALRFV